MKSTRFGLSNTYSSPLRPTSNSATSANSEVSSAPGAMRSSSTRRNRPASGTAPTVRAITESLAVVSNTVGSVVTSVGSDISRPQAVATPISIIAPRIRIVFSVGARA